MDDVVGDVGKGEFQAALKAQRRGKDEAAIQIVGNEIAGEIAAVESQIMVGDQKGVEPRKKGSIEGIDAADDEKEEKFSGEKMMSDRHGFCLFPNLWRVVPAMRCHRVHGVQCLARFAIQR